MHRLSVPVADGALALVAGTAALLGTPHAARLQDETGPGRGGYALVALAAGSLALRRRAPGPALAVCGAAVAAYLASGAPFGPVLVLLAVSVGSAALHLPPRAAVAWPASVLVGATLVSLPGVDGNPLWALWMVLPWAAATAWRARRDVTRRQREEELRRSAYEERLRLAQEIHDSVGHGLAVIAMQAGVALHVLDRRPEDVRRSLVAIRDTSRASLDGLRGTLQALGLPEGADGPPLAPVPGVEQVERLVEGVRAGGLEVALRVEPDVREVPEPVGQAVYRIVQEALTNVVRHAQAGRAEVTLGLDAGELLVVVSDDGRGASSAEGQGLGLPGMHARAAALGGELSAGPSPSGGFRVAARLPLPARVP
ncbi:histidine kinase/DNA gyrase B/HSP90-like ATPase [Motilibacter peucedani]|uniref:histidine kinase n=1 Tax=Motilibacter peucedani TaxID=598650 RepID=A0A420XVU0_9ACTN|nr:sensor histidine kinase [Motilibacter peucedani]RKS84294.1 histidine kinase/DNA gyrase B/HSP90-like ATPase [Motilibacter peucedani]